MKLYDDENALFEFFGFNNRLWQDERQKTVENAKELKPDAVLARVNRVKNSHRGIRAFTGVEELLAGSVNQDFLDEICALPNLKVLFMGYPVTAMDLSGLSALENLHTLKIDSPRNITDFSVLAKMPNLRTLFVENAKHLRDLDFLSDAHHLRVIGVEGDMSTNQKVTSLQPLSGLKSLEALFMRSVQLADKDLTYLSECKKLRLLFCARFAPKKSFEALQTMMPNLDCAWFDKYEINV